MVGALWLTVEIAPGTSEADAAEEMVALAERTGVIIEAKHNGDSMVAQPGDTVDDVISNFSELRESLRVADASFLSQ